MNGINLTPSSDETPAVDRAEVATGHPHTLGVEFTDDELLVGEGPGSPDMAEFGEAPDIETHTVEPHTFDDDETAGAPSPDL